MTFSDPRYARSKAGGLSKLPPQLQGLIHENPLQEIQGGAPGEHYHLTKKQHDYASYYFEPVMTITGDIVTVDSGDIVMSPVLIP